MSRRRIARFSVVAFASFAIACGGPSVRPEQADIEVLRRQAAERPDDPRAQFALAEAELLLRRGDASAAGAQIDRALALAEGDVRLHYLKGIERALHGDGQAALEAFLEVLRRAPASEEPLAPTLAELAISEISALDDNVPDFVGTIGTTLETVAAAPGRLGQPARTALAELRMDLAYRRGDLEAVSALTESERCLTEYRVAGPFGPRQLLGFDEALPPEEDDALRERYDLGPGRGERATREVHARGCVAHIGAGPVAGPGTSYAEGEVEISRAGRYLLRLETPNAVELFVDGRSIVRQDTRQTPSPRVTYHAVELEPGTRRLRAKITSRHDNPVIRVSLADLSGSPGDGRVPGDSLTSQLLAAQRAFSRGAPVAAREQLRRHVRPDGSAVFLVLGAAVALSDPLRSTEISHDEARDLLEHAARRDPDAFFPALTLARLEASQGRALEAIATLREASERWPRVPGVALSLFDLLEARGWHAESERVLEGLREAMPGACRPLRGALNVARRRSRAGDERAAAEALVRCDARSDAMLTAHLRRRDWDRASEELERLAALEPPSSRLSAEQGALGIARARGDSAEVSRRLARLQEALPRAAGFVLGEVDTRLANGEREPALARIERALAEEPAAMMDLRRTLRALGGESPLEAYRQDGLETIRAYEASDVTYDEPMVMVLDYTVYRVFEDASMLELTHNIFRLQSQEAVDAMGELQVPDDAQLLTVRTVKADGRTLEPDEIEGKDTLSLPNLAPGDYIEWEWLRPRPPPAGYPGGFVGDRFYFRNVETPFDRSELSVVAPRSMPIVVDPRGEAPRTETRDEGDLRIYAWRVSQSRPLVREPGSVSAREYFPSIYWGHGATWEDHIASLRDILADREIHDPAARRLVRHILGGSPPADPMVRARRIYHWVLANIEDSNDVFGQAAAMLAARTGNRARVLRYLYELADVPARLVVVRHYAADPTEGALPEEDTYTNLLVVVDAGPEPVWLHTGSRGTPFGYVPAPLAGMDGLSLGPDAERLRVRPRGPEEDLRTIEADIRLGVDGQARVSVVETHRGAGAVGWRGQLEQVAEADLERQFESGYVTNFLPGAQLVRLTVAGRDDPEAPLVLRYEADVPTLARPSRGGFVVPGLFLARLAPQFARMPSRTTTQVVAAPLAIDVRIRIRPPEGARLGEVSAEERLAGPEGASVAALASREGDALVLERRYRLPRMRVAPDDYAAFARFCRRADEVEAVEVRYRP